MKSPVAFCSFLESTRKGCVGAPSLDVRTSIYLAMPRK